MENRFILKLNSNKYSRVKTGFIHRNITACIRLGGFFIILNNTGTYFAVLFSKVPFCHQSVPEILAMKSILYIDDEPNILEAYALMLEHNGYTVFKAQDGNEGLKIMLSEEIDLVLSDINMPKKNGLTLIKQIRRILRYRNVPVVILSAVGTKHNVFKGVELGVDSFLTKPCDKERLLTTIENALCSENRIRSASVLKKRSSHSAGGTPGHAKILLSYK